MVFKVEQARAEFMEGFATFVASDDSAVLKTVSVGFMLSPMLFGSKDMEATITAEAKKILQQVLDEI